MSDKNTSVKYTEQEHTASVLDEMDTSNKNLQNIGVELLTVHTEGTVHAKRIGGKFRQIKWIVMALWSIFFLSPYLRWDGHQAILFDLGARQFHIFWITILPQDIWMLAMILLFFALLLAATTAIAGRLWCGYACFHTVWVDAFTWLEEKFEGQPNKRIKLEQEPWGLKKIKIKLPKWLSWAAIGFLTGFTFVSYFDPVYDLWYRLFLFEWSFTETTIILGLGAATVFFAGFLREQVCIGFCPYARIQGTMIDTETLVPTYDVDRGEPRGRMKRPKPGEEPPELGDCIDCNLCVAVCPTGVDIRKGQQFGCITCGLCIDACDSVMEKIKKPKGLIRYASLAEFAGKPFVPLFKRPRVLVYSGIMLFAAGMLLWGLLTMTPIDLKVLHERAPLFVQMSDGTVQNKYYVKVVNKADRPLEAKLTVSGPSSLIYIVDKTLRVLPGEVGTAELLVKIPDKDIKETNTPIEIHVQDINNPAVKADYDSMFIGPRKH
ncbi:MAG: cytochrome c oxidase accessory protein CcoG [Hydrogenovibrio sp.]|nr:cytochrome c oxidase accessory protein CcoG [Hydrogenovibrio sp.]